MTRIGGSTRRSAIPLVLVGLGVVALVGGGLLGPRPSTSVQPDGTPRPSIDVPETSGPAVAGVRPAPSLLVLTSPSHDDAVVVGRLAVVGFVRGSSRNVSLALGDGERVVGTWFLASQAKAGDPAFHTRAWFETTLGIESLPMGRPLWLEVGIVRDDGAVDSIRRSFRLGPIVEPDTD